jgi:hypothetical protein
MSDSGAWHAQLVEQEIGTTEAWHAQRFPGLSVEPQHADQREEGASDLENRPR